MSEVKNAGQGAVTSIADNDLVMCVANGSYHPISFENLMKAVRGGIQVGGRNLVRNSWISAQSDTYLVAQYPYAEIPEPGETLIVTIWGQLGSGKTGFNVFNGGGNGSFGSILTTKVADGVHRGALKILQKVTNSNELKVTVFSAPQSVTATCTINRIKVERGNIATDWTPAPEDIASGSWGGGNWLFTNYLQFGMERRCA